MNEETAQVKKKDRQEIKIVGPLDILVSDGLNIREDYGDMSELIDSISRNGVLVPVQGYYAKGQNKWVLVDGHRRHRACMTILADTGEEIPIKVIPVASNAVEDIIVGMFTLNNGKPLTALEQAEGVNRLKSHGWPVKQIAERLNLGEGNVRNLLVLASAPEKIKAFLRENKVSATTLIQGLRSFSPDELLVRLQNLLPDDSLFEAIAPDGEEQKPSRVKAKDLLGKETKPKKETALASLKRLIAESEHRTIRKNKQELFDFATIVVNNDVTESELEALLFEPMTQAQRDAIKKAKADREKELLEQFEV